VATGDVEVGNHRDPGVDDRDIRIDPRVIAVDRGDGVDESADARDPGRDGLRGQVDDLVGDEGFDVRVGQQVVLLVLVELG
jgi:hypothetical protein